MSKPSREPKEHDFTRSRWGWAITVHPDNTAIGHGSGIRAGDTILLRMTSGRIGIGEVETIDYYRDPPDMFTMKIVPIGYKEQSTDAK